MLDKASAAVPMEPTASAPNVQAEVRKYFPETWIWDCSDARFVFLSNYGLTPTFRIFRRLGGCLTIFVYGTGNYQLQTYQLFCYIV